MVVGTLFVKGMRRQITGLGNFLLALGTVLFNIVLDKQNKEALGT